MRPYTDQRYMTDLQNSLTEFKAVNPHFRWRTSDGEKLPPAGMRTDHLFYTLRMVWNNFMPKEFSVGQRVKHYRFSHYYTDNYLMEAVQHLAAELKTRDDIKDWQLSQLAQMHNYLLKQAAPRLEPVPNE